MVARAMLSRERPTVKARPTTMGRAAGRRAPAPAKPPWNANFADDRPLDRAARAGGGKPAGDDALGATLPKFKQSVHVGDRVRDRHSGREGVCLFVGGADFARGRQVCGVRLDKRRTTTECDGKYRGERYFRCTPGHGLYIPLEDAEFIGVAEPARRRLCAPNARRRVRRAVGAAGGGIPRARDAGRAAGPARAAAAPTTSTSTPSWSRWWGSRPSRRCSAACATPPRCASGARHGRQRRPNDAHALPGQPATGKTTIEPARAHARRRRRLKKGQLIEATARGAREDMLPSRGIVAAAPARARRPSPRASARRGDATLFSSPAPRHRR